MRIGELARTSGVGVETVRFYEKKGLIAQPPRPGDGGYRDYAAGAVRRIAFIRRAQRLGFSLVEVAELLALESGSGARCADVRRRAEAKREQVQGRIDRLKEIRDALDVLIEACPGEGPARACSIIEAIGRREPKPNPVPGGETHERIEAQDRNL